MHLNGEQEIEDQVQVHTSVTWSNVYSGAVSEFSRAALGQVRLGPPCPQVCPNLFLLWPGYKVSELGSDIHVNISPSLTEHSYEQVSDKQNCFQQETHRTYKSEIRCSNELSGTKHFLILAGLVCNNQEFLDIDVQVSEWPVSWSEVVGVYCVGHWDCSSRSHLPGGQFSRVSLTTWGVPLTQGFTTTFLQF